MQHAEKHSHSCFWTRASSTSENAMVRQVIPQKLSSSRIEALFILLSFQEQHETKMPVEHPLFSRCNGYVTSMCVSGTEVIGPDEDRTCPIEVEDFDKVATTAASMDFVPTGTCFVEGHPELCVGTLKECGHRFSPIAILYHMCLSGMQCPVCRY